MQLGLCSITRRHDPLADIGREAAAAGIDGIELWGQPPHLSELTEAAGRAAREIVEAAGLAPLVMGSYLRPGTDSFAEQVDGVIAATIGYGAPLLRVWAADVSDCDADEAVWERCLADFETLLDRCGELIITVERHGKTLSESAAGSARLLEALPDPRLTLNFQHQNGHGTADDVAEIHRFGPRISNVHAQNRRGSQAWGIAGGDLDYGSIVQALHEVGFDGAIEVEFVRYDGRQNDLTPEEHTAALLDDVACLAQAIADAVEEVEAGDEA